MMNRAMGLTTRSRCNLSDFRTETALKSEEKPPARLALDDYVQGVLAADRVVLGRALTLVESDHPRHVERARQLVSRLWPQAGGSSRVGITGAPGVGKSTLIDRLGLSLCEDGRKVAVLAVDPSSQISGGSLLGDETRMQGLSRHQRAFVRATPSSGHLGGVARKTRESILLCEAAGFDVVFVETVGVGQSEAIVADMVDFFAVLILPGGGDQLQGIKRGILEVADLVAVNKADGAHRSGAEITRREYRQALKILRPPSEGGWTPPVIACSALEGPGLDEFWETATKRLRQLSEDGELAEKRRRQLIGWMWSAVDESLKARLRCHPEVVDLLPGLEEEVLEGRQRPAQAAEAILEAYLGAGRQ